MKGLSWDAGAVGNASWSGVLLRDVLHLVGVTEENEKCQHVQVKSCSLYMDILHALLIDTK